MTSISVPSKYTSGLESGQGIVTNATEASALRNREFIGTVLQKYLVGSETVFEVGTGTAAQAVFFCERFQKVTWQTSDVEFYHAGIIEKLRGSTIPEERLKKPLEFDIDSEKMQSNQYDLFYASNVVHCIPWNSAKNLFKHAKTALKADGLCIFYGPYNIKDASNLEGIYTSEGNRNFDLKLKSQDSRLGLREIGEVIELAAEQGLAFSAKYLHEAANNYVLVFKKVVDSSEKTEAKL